MTKRSAKKSFKIVAAIVIAAGLIAGAYLIVRADPLSVSDTFDDDSKVASSNNICVYNGQVTLAEESWSILNPCNCNNLDGWYWYDTNGREACWSKTLARSTAWNKGVGNDFDNPGTYTCATDVSSLQDRMTAVAAGEWYKIVSSVNSTTITSSHNGSSGYSVISALAISDCLDGTRDLCTGDGCLGDDSGEVMTSLKTWALETGDKSALPYCADSYCSGSSNSDYRNACEQNSGNDLPLSCNDGQFYYNNRVCGTEEGNYNWGIVTWSNGYIFGLGAYGCSDTSVSQTSSTFTGNGFRIVVRP